MEILEIVSAEKNLPKLAIEKDWWVTIELLLAEVHLATFSLGKIFLLRSVDAVNPLCAGIFN